MLMSLFIQIQHRELPQDTQKSITWTDIFRDRNDHLTISLTTGITIIKVIFNDF
jgi:hypothetical protein